MELADIRKSISEMSEEELRSHLTTLRSNRRISKKPRIEAKQRKLAKEGASLSTDTLLKTISADQAAQLLALMEGGSK
jgi:hypothetical protein